MNFLKHRYRKNTDSSLVCLSFDAWVIGEWPRAPWIPGTQTTAGQQAGGWDLGLPLSLCWVFVKGCQTHSFNQKAPRWCLEFDMDRSSLSDRSLSIDCVLFAGLRPRHLGRCTMNAPSSSISTTSPRVAKWELCGWSNVSQENAENLRAARPGGFRKRVRRKLESRTGNTVCWRNRHVLRRILTATQSNSSPFAS